MAKKFKNVYPDAVVTTFIELLRDADMEVIRYYAINRFLRDCDIHDSNAFIVSNMEVINRMGYRTLSRLKCVHHGEGQTHEYYDTDIIPDLTNPESRDRVREHQMRGRDR